MSTKYNGIHEEVTALNAFISLSRAVDTMGKRSILKVATYGLTVPQFGILEALLHLGPLEQHILGEKLLVSGGNVTYVVDKLVKAGYVERIASPQDRRCKTVQLTEKGSELIERVFSQQVDFIRDLMESLSLENQVELTKLCKKVGLDNKNKYLSEKK